MLRSNEAVRGALTTIVVLWLAAIPFALAADAHYDGPLAAPTGGAPRNFLQFQSRDVLSAAAFYSFLLALHWVMLWWMTAPLRSHRWANVLLSSALAILCLTWLDAILDGYYRFSLFCSAMAEPVFALDLGWRCLSAMHARDLAMPLAIIALIIGSAILRFRSGQSAKRD